MSFIRRTWAEIDLDALGRNFAKIKSRANGPVMAVIKADAYGHGAAILAKELEALGADSFAVSNLDEAVELRHAGITLPILILGFTPAERAPELCKYDVAQAVFSLGFAKALNAAAGDAGVNVKCHLKLDTGMGRIGFDCRNSELCGANEMFEAAMLSNLEIEGAFTHFASADSHDESDIEFTTAQHSRFMSALEILKQNTGIAPKFIHCRNSAALLLQPDMQHDISRAGIILYGLTPAYDLSLPDNFEAVMSLKSVVSMVKSVRAGESVSYGRTYSAEKDAVLATIPVGYADGYNRLLSNKGYVLINGKKANIVGRVCMDQMMVDVTDIEVQTGDEVLLFGNGLPVEILAEMCGTINYEMVCAVSRRVPRIYIKNGKPVKQVSYLDA